MLGLMWPIVIAQGQTHSMTITLKDYKLFYAAVPKVACTSVKRMFFEFENEREFEPLIINGRRWGVHKYYPRMPRGQYPEKAIENYRRLTLVREPIKRFLSAYSNRVLHHNKVDEETVKSVSRFRSLTPRPELDEFVDRFEDYFRISEIHHHCRPMIHWLGTDASYFDAVYGIHQIGEFASDVSNVLGSDVEVGRHQTGGPKLDPGLLTAKQTAKLHKFYAADYEAFSSHF